MTELIWDGKYDAHGMRVAPLRVLLPFQTVETINESSQQRQMALDLFSDGRGFDLPNVQSYSGHGLQNMQERAEVLGAEFKVISAVGKGTKIEVKLPVKK